MKNYSESTFTRTIALEWDNQRKSILEGETMDVYEKFRTRNKMQVYDGLNSEISNMELIMIYAEHGTVPPPVPPKRSRAKLPASFAPVKEENEDSDRRSFTLPAAQARDAPSPATYAGDAPSNAVKQIDPHSKGGKPTVRQENQSFSLKRPMEVRIKTTRDVVKRPSWRKRVSSLLKFW